MGDDAPRLRRAVVVCGRRCAQHGQLGWLGERRAAEGAQKGGEGLLAYRMRATRELLARDVVKGEHAALGNRPVLDVLPVGEADGPALVHDIPKVVDAGGLVHAVRLEQSLQYLAVGRRGEIEPVRAGRVERVEDARPRLARLAVPLAQKRDGERVLEPEVAHRGSAADGLDQRERTLLAERVAVELKGAERRVAAQRLGDRHRAARADAIGRRV
mmetsp:Transcript_14523/g.42779  ORF Transcript_14523/g.42779 Transcript_14523/m.42779 type:complete len:215 (+) Transcript_14523:821-1465(+)